MRFLILKTAFCPDLTYLNTTLKSLIKTNIFIEMISKKNSEIKFDLLIIGWVKTFQKHIDLTLSLIQLNFENIYKEYWYLNYGKYKIYNFLIDFIKQYASNDYNGIFILDHDIYFDFNSFDTFFELFTLQKLLIEGKQLGVIAFNQKLDVRHQREIYNNCLKYHHLNIVWPNNIGSIATGGIFLYPETILNLNYFDLFTVYGLDDYYLCKQLIDKGFLNVVLENIYIIHPKDMNIKYTQWKIENIKKLIDHRNADYFRNIEESMNFHAYNLTIQ